MKSSKNIPSRAGNPPRMPDRPSPLKHMSMRRGSDGDLQPVLRRRSSVSSSARHAMAMALANVQGGSAIMEGGVKALPESYRQRARAQYSRARKQMLVASITCSLLNRMELSKMDHQAIYMPEHSSDDEDEDNPQVPDQQHPQRLACAPAADSCPPATHRDSSVGTTQHVPELAAQAPGPRQARAAALKSLLSRRTAPSTDNHAPLSAPILSHVTSTSPVDMVEPARPQIPLIDPPVVLSHTEEPTQKQTSPGKPKPVLLIDTKFTARFRKGRGPKSSSSSPPKSSSDTDSATEPDFRTKRSPSMPQLMGLSLQTPVDVRRQRLVPQRARSVSSPMPCLGRRKKGPPPPLNLNGVTEKFTKDMGIAVQPEQAPVERRQRAASLIETLKPRVARAAGLPVFAYQGELLVYEKETWSRHTIKFDGRTLMCMQGSAQLWHVDMNQNVMLGLVKQPPTTDVPWNLAFTVSTPDCDRVLRACSMPELHNWMHVLSRARANFLVSPSSPTPSVPTPNSKALDAESVRALADFLVKFANDLDKNKSLVAANLVSPSIPSTLDFVKSVLDSGARAAL